MSTYKHFQQFLPMNVFNNQFGSVSLVSLDLLWKKLQDWVRREIVDDDPWDVESVLKRKDHDARSSTSKKGDRKKQLIKITLQR